MGDQAKAGAAHQGGEPPSKLKVGDKEYGADDVNNLLQQTSANTQKLEAAKPLLDLCQQYGITPDILAQQSSAAFGLVSTLIDQGLIDENGKVLAKPGPAPGGELPPTSGTTPPVVPPGQKGDALAMEALTQITERLKTVDQRLKAIDDAQSGMIRRDLEKTLKTMFPLLDDEDVGIVLNQSLATKGNLAEIAKARSEAKAGKQKAFEQELAKKWGVDLEKVNQQTTFDPQAGGAALFPGKKFSFLKKEGSLSPREASGAYLRQALKGD